MQENNRVHHVADVVRILRGVVGIGFYDDSEKVSCCKDR